MTDFADKMAELRQRFVARCPAWLEDLGAALDACDDQAVAALAHRIAGNAGMFGYPELSEVAAELENAAIDGDHQKNQARGSLEASPIDPANRRPAQRMKSALARGSIFIFCTRRRRAVRSALYIWLHDS